MNLKDSVQQRIRFYVESLKQDFTQHSPSIEGTEFELLDFYIRLIECLSTAGSHLDSLLQEADSCKDDVFAILPGIPLAEPQHALPLLGIPLFFDTPQHIAPLITAGMPINQQDTKGATVLHLAAMLHQYPTYDTLVAMGADPTIEDRYGASPQHLREAGSTSSGTQYSVDALLSFWIDSPYEVDPPLAHYLYGHRPEVAHLYTALHEHKVSPPDTLLLSAPLSDAPHEQGLFAHTHLPAGTCFEYPGHYDPFLAPKDRDFNFGHLDLSGFKNVTSFINDGVPNCKFVTLIEKGLPKAYLITTTSIAANEQLFCNYGFGHGVKGWDGDTQHLELSPHPFSTLLSQTRAFTYYLSLDEESFQEWTFVNGTYQKTPLQVPHDQWMTQWYALLYIQELYNYVLSTPTTLVELVLHHNLDVASSGLACVATQLLEHPYPRTEPFITRSIELLSGLSALSLPTSPFPTSQLQDIYDTEGLLGLCTFISQEHRIER